MKSRWCGKLECMSNHVRPATGTADAKWAIRDGYLLSVAIIKQIHGEDTVVGHVLGEHLPSVTPLFEHSYVNSKIDMSSPHARTGTTR